MVVAPLVHHGATVGVLKVLSPLPNTFDAGDVTTLQMLADFVASAINRASIFDDAARLASTDGLTGLANRRAMIEYLAEGLEQIARREDNLAVLFIDLDGFKPINDTYGHGTGDEVLIIISKRLHGCCRDTDFVARVGGDEFCVIAPGCKDAALDAMVERIRSSVEAPLRLRSTPERLRVGASIGIATARGIDDPHSLVARADAAMYAVKRTHHDARMSAGPARSHPAAAAHERVPSTE